MDKEFVFPFEKLEIWRLSVDLADYILNVLAACKDNKYFRLMNQMEAAAASVTQNITEGKGRQHKKEFIQFLYVAEGSLFEVLTLTEIFRRRKVIQESEAIEIKGRAEMIDRKLHGLIKSLRSRA